MMHFTSRTPAVSAVIATNGKRPELLRVAVRSIPVSYTHLTLPTTPYV